MELKHLARRCETQDTHQDQNRDLSKAEGNLLHACLASEKKLRPHVLGVIQRHPYPNQHR